MKISSCFFASMFIFVTGCAPLQQAPLVYSSKVSIGLDVHSTAAEVPGVGINIGYKQVDAAYVPVAVARNCEGSSPAACNADTYKIVTISGKSDDQSDSSDPLKIEKARIKRAEFESAKQSLPPAAAAYDRAVIEHQAFVDKSARRKLLIQKYDSSNSTQIQTSSQSASEQAVTPIAASTAPITENAGAAAEKKELEDLMKITDLDALIANAAKKKSDKQAERDALDLQVKALASDPAVIDALNVLKGLNTKNDAFSVFGSFDANAGAQAGKASTGTENQGTGASLKIGRVFSTGVAAQNLTEGFRSVYAQSRLDAVTSCLNGVSAVVKDIADAAEKAKQAAALSAFCKPEQSRQSVGAP